jgi:hypothetical protein
MIHQLPRRCSDFCPSERFEESGMQHIGGRRARVRGWIELAPLVRPVPGTVTSKPLMVFETRCGGLSGPMLADRTTAALPPSVIEMTAFAISDPLFDTFQQDLDLC